MALTPLRLQLILKEVKQTDIARKAGVHRATINRVVQGKTRPSAKVAAAFRAVAGIELEGQSQ